MKFRLTLDDNDAGGSDSRKEAESLFEGVMAEMNAGRQVGSELALWTSERLLRTFTSL